MSSAKPQRVRQGESWCRRKDRMGLGAANRNISIEYM